MSNQIVISSGAKVRNLSGVLTGTSGIVNSLGINVPDGIPQLDGSGKILVSQLPNSVMEYKGTWNASTNTPTLANGTGNAGDVYLCNVAGTTNFGAGPITFAVGDQVLYSGTTWEKASGATGTVTSVAVTESGDALTITGSPITTSGTINIGFAGTGSQYIKGDGTLATFPTTIDQAKRLITEVYNSTGSTLTKGTVVYINGGQGNLPTITKAQANADNTSAQTYGVVQSDITNMNNGFVVVFGSLTDLDTQAYSVGTQLYLSGTTAGAWTSTKPSAPIHLVYVGIVVRSHPTQGVVEIRIQNGYELEELHDVAISSVANNDGIFYNSSNDLWENKTIGEVLGYTPANDSLVVHLAGTETITGAKTFSASLTAASTALFNNGILLKDGASSVSAGHFSISSLNSTSLGFQSSGGRGFDMILPTSGGQITIPNGSGTLALTSNLSSYVPYTGATTFVNLGTQLFYSGGVEVANGGNGSIITDGYLRAGKGIFLTDTVSGGQWSSGTTNLVARSSGFLITRNSGGGVLIFDPSVTYNYTFPAVSGTIALTSNLSSYLPLSGGTLTGALSGTSATFSGNSFLATSSGDVGVGTSTPNLTAANRKVIDINGTTESLISFSSGGTNKSYIFNDGTNLIMQGATLKFQTGYTDRLTIASSGIATFSNRVIATDNDNVNALWAVSNSVNGAGLQIDNSGRASGSRFGILVGNVANGTFSIKDETNNATRFQIASSGAATFSGGVIGVQGTNQNYIRLSPSAGGAGFSIGRSLSDNNAQDFFIYDGIANATRLFINSSGNVGIGTSSPTYKLDIRNDVAASTSLDPISIGLYNGNDGGSAIYFRNSVGGQSKISFGVNSTGSGTDDTYLGFSTGGNTSLSERARFTSLGFFKASDNGSYGDLGGLYHELLNSNGGNNILAIKNTASSNPYGVDIAYTNSSPNNDSNNFIYARDSTTPRFVVRANGGIANYQSNNTNLSDERTKKDISLLESYWDKFKAIEIVKFKYKDQTHDDFNIGVIAQQVEAVAPEFVDIDGWDNKPKFDEDGNEIISNEEPLKSIYTADLHHATIKVLQEAMAKIEVLEAKIKQLENK